MVYKIKWTNQTGLNQKLLKKVFSITLCCFNNLDGVLFLGSFYLLYHLVRSLCTGLIFKATKLALNENLHKAPVFLMSLVDKDHQVSRPRSEEWRGRARILCWGPCCCMYVYALWSLHIISIKLTSIKLDKNSNIFTTEQEGEVLFTQAILYIIGM